MEVFLEKGRSKFSVNSQMKVNVPLSAKGRLLPYNNVDETFSLYDLYKSEIDACNKFRLIFTLNPICTNALFNARTEVVRKEGSDSPSVLIGTNIGDSGNAVNTTRLTIEQAIRDTEYSMPELYDDNDPYVYHCGWDIMNNHLLRTTEFINVSTADTKNTTFNTIFDCQRNFSGKTIEEKIGIDGTTDTKMHIYRYDNVNTIYDAFSEKTQIKDGWYGFVNQMNMMIPNYKTLDGDEYCINRIMNNNKPCEFIDFYPDRSLYSFIPKVNKYRQRVEHNWDYCITYPYKNDSDKLNEIVGLPASLMEDNGKAAMLIVSNEVYGNNYVRFKTMMKHALLEGDYVSVYYKSGNDVKKCGTKARVVSVGNMDGTETDRYFSIKLFDISIDFSFVDDDGYKSLILKDNRPFSIYYKKNISGYDCKYYFRKFKHLRRLSDDKEFNNQITKLAYGENIYGDRVAQLVYTDDIDLNGIVDNNGRHLSEIFFTIVKTNRGHEEWYDDNNFKSDKVEFSHCFSKVTSGIDMGVEEECFDYNARRIHNISYNELDENSKGVFGGIFNDFNESPKVLEDDVKSSFDEFYGDIVEFDPVNVVETVLENVQYRFNTAQRETTNSDYSNILYDMIVADDYDAGVNESYTGFTVNSGYLNNVSGSTIVNAGDMSLFKGNICPEGYFYKPHNRIKLRDISDDIESVVGTIVTYKSGTVKSEQITVGSFSGDMFTIEVPSKQNFIKYDKVAAYDKKSKECVWGYVDSCVVDEKNFVTILKLVFGRGKLSIGKFTNMDYSIIVTDDYVPDYANYLEDSHVFVWRNTVPPSELTSESDLYNMPFSNGCFYIEQNIDLFLKRQDPRNEYRMLSSEIDGVNNPLKGYQIYGWDKIDFSGVIYFARELMSSCR